MSNLSDKLRRGTIVRRSHGKQRPYYRISYECPSSDEYRVFVAQRLRRDGVGLQGERTIVYRVDENRLVGWYVIDKPPWEPTPLIDTFHTSRRLTIHECAKCGGGIDCYDCECSIESRPKFCTGCAA